jgi:hypothetical protein
MDSLKQRLRLEDNIKMCLKGTGCDGIDDMG